MPVADPWFARVEVEPGIHRPTEPHCRRPIRANLFLVKGSERDLMVDTGLGIGDPRGALAPWLDGAPVVVATHADHIGGHHAFRDCEIPVHPAEAADLRDPPVPRGLGFDHFEPHHRAALDAMGFDTDGPLIDAVPAPGPATRSATRCSWTTSRAAGGNVHGRHGTGFGHGRMVAIVDAYVAGRAR